VSLAVGPKYAKMDLHQVNEYPWLTIPSRSVNTTTALVLLLDDVFVSQVDDEDIFFNNSRVNAISRKNIVNQWYTKKKDI